MSSKRSGLRRAQLTDPVNVSLNVRLKAAFGTCIRHIIVDDHVDLLNVDTSRNDIGSDENFGFAVSESVENRVSLLRLLVAVK